MKSLTKAAALAILLALLVPVKIVAADYITDAVQALQDASVFVAPGTERTDQDTISTLQSRLDKDDNIVLVMLPSAATTELGADPYTIAIRLSEALGDQRIIGLAVGNEVVGYAPSLPEGVASDLMRRADSVSNDPVTSLITYTQNVHRWQVDNPTPQPTSPLKPDSGSDVLFLVIGISVVVIILAIVGLMLSSGGDDTSKPRTKFEAPDPVKNLLSQIVRERENVHDRELQDSLYKICEDIERYFLKSSKNKKRDSQIFVGYLEKAASVLEKYIDIQNNPRYYRSSEEKLREGKESLIDFGHFVLESIRRGTSADLIHYNMATDILQARRYS